MYALTNEVYYVRSMVLNCIFFYDITLGEIYLIKNLDIKCIITHSSLGKQPLALSNFGYKLHLM